MVTHLHVNKEMCVCHNKFHYFVHLCNSQYSNVSPNTTLKFQHQMNFPTQQCECHCLIIPCLVIFYGKCT